jgi:hypothetical protein
MWACRTAQKLARRADQPHPGARTADHRPVPPTPTPQAEPADPLKDFPVATTKAWLKSKHNYNHTEAAAATAITAWAAEYGISFEVS